MNAAEQVKMQRAEMLKNKYAHLLVEASEAIRRKGVYEYECPNDCDASANNVSDYFKNEGFNVKRVLWKPWRSDSFTKIVEVQV